MSGRRCAGWFVEQLEQRRLLAGEPWGDFPQLISLDDAAARYPQIDGSGQAVAVIDTGVDYDHPALGGGLGPGFTVVAGWDFIDNDGDPVDEDGHGTGVASVIAADEYVFNGERYRGLAPGVKIVALRARGERQIESALQWVMSHRTQYNIVAVNMSLGEGSHAGPVSLEPYGDELSTLHDAGVFVSAVSGNRGVTSPPSINYPAAHPDVYAVGAVDEDGVISEFTQRSDDLDLLAPGEELPLPYWDKERQRHVYVPATGTSFAAPHAAAMAALLKQVDPSLSPDEIMSILQQSGSANFDGDDESGRTTGLTFRRLDVAGAVGMALGRIDDSLEDDDSPSAATELSMEDGSAAVGGVRVVSGDADYFTLDLERTSRVAFDLDLGGGVEADLLNEDGGRITGLDDGDDLRQLAAGRYYLRFTLSSGISGAYGFDVAATPAGPPVIHGAYSSMATDAHGMTHIAYYDTDSKTLKYATRSADGVWSGIETIDGAGKVGQFVSLAIDRKGRPAVAYYDATNRDVKYALHHADDGWDVQKVDAAGSVGQYTSLVFTPKNHAAISYYADTGHDLRVAELVKGQWRVTTVDAAQNVGRHGSLAVNPATGRLGVAYVNSTNDSVRFAEMISSTKWQAVTVDKTGKGASYVSLAYDGSGKPSISYYDAALADLRFARRGSVAGDFAVQTVASKGSAGKFSRVFIEPGTTTASILYFDASADGVYEARMAKGKGWSIRAIADDGGAHLSAAVLSGGEKVVLWRDDEGVLREAVG